jgi:hypothetical protein
MFTGLYIGVLGISAVSSFWNEAPDSLKQPNLLVSALNGLPNYAPIIPAIIAAFGIMLVVLILLRLSRIWWWDKEPDTFVVVTKK